MRRSQSVLMFMGIGLAFCVTHVQGIDPPTKAILKADRVERDLENAQALEEISRIREKLGGSVLQGSILDSSDDAGSDAFRSKPQLPKKNPNVRSLSHKLTQAQMVVVLRKHSSQLDGIANEIETLRQYNSADRLRDIADEVRLVARQLDAPITGKADEAVR